MKKFINDVWARFVNVAGVIVKRSQLERTDVEYPEELLNSEDGETIVDARNGRSRVYRVTLYGTMGHVLIETASDSQWYRFADDKADDVKAVLALIGEMADCSKTLVKEPERRGELDDKLDELKERCIELITDYDD